MSGTPVWLTLPRLVSLRWPPRVAIVFCGILGTLLPAAYGTAFGIAEPVIHDEFAYLLGADTFAEGRLTNPTPPLPEFFEAPHILVVPSYTSKYPPGQSLFLAVGKFAGEPIWGVWVSCGVFAAALCWMLQAWSSRTLALTVTVLAVCTLGTSSYWSQSYWGGMPAAAGGALLLGGMRRAYRAPRAAPSVLMGLGVLLLANTRPYEGLLLCIPAALLLIREGIRTRDSATIALKRVVLPCASVLVTGAIAMAFYNHAVTGNALETPYELHLGQYFDRGVFLFSEVRQPERQPTDRIARFYENYASPPVHGRALLTLVMSHAPGRLLGSLAAAFGLAQPAARGAREPYRGALLWIVLLMCSWTGLSNSTFVLATLAACLIESLVWYYVPLYPIPLWVPVIGTWLAVFIVQARTTTWTLFIIAGILIVVIGQAFVSWWWSHYSAPIVPLVLAGAALTLQRLALTSHAAHPARPLGAVLAMIVCTHLLTLTMVHASRGIDSQPQSDLTLSRAELIARLESQGRRDLVFVRYTPDASVHEEWVYNSAALAQAPVIFAHDLGTEKNNQLIAALPGREVWLVSVSSLHIAVDPYSR